MKLVSLFFLALGICSVGANAKDKAPEIKSIFTNIASKADTANGGTSIDSFDLNLKKAQLVEKSKAALEKEYWEDCGPWTNITSRREAIHDIEKLEAANPKGKVVEHLNALYDSDKIVAVFATISSGKVECSLHWFHFYGADGTVMDMRYNVGD
ncbi:MAG: hypothetical protein ACXWQO_00580 [Bdellovibrionota bacterium]